MLASTSSYCSRNRGTEISKLFELFIFLFLRLGLLCHQSIILKFFLRLLCACMRIAYTYGHITRSLKLCKISQRRHFFERPATYVTTKLSKRGSGLFFCVFYMQPRQNFTCTAGIWPYHEAFQNYVKIAKTAFL